MKRLMLISFFGLLFNVARSQTDTTSKWLYPETTNEMTSVVSHFADVDSELGDGDCSVTLTLRNSTKTEALLSIDHCMFDVGLYEFRIDVKFDDDKIDTYSCDKSGDNEFTVIFIRNSKKFISRLKSAHKLLIQTHIYSQGNKIFKFNVQNLKWQY